MHTSVFLLLHHEWLSVKPLLFPSAQAHWYLLPSLSECFYNFPPSRALAMRLPNRLQCFLLFCLSLVQLLFWEAVCQGLWLCPANIPWAELLLLPRYLGTCLVFAALGSWLLQPYQCVCCKSPRSPWKFSFVFCLLCRVYCKPLVSLVCVCGNW